MTILQTIAPSGMTWGNCVAEIPKRPGGHSDIDAVTVTLQPPHAEARTRRALSAGGPNTWLEPVGHYRVAISGVSPPSPAVAALPEKNPVAHRPLIILPVYLLAVTGSVLFAAGAWHSDLAVSVFMGGFFIAFSFFKMLDVRGFADACRTYDPVARAWPGYGLIYPFIALGLGLAYPAKLNPWAVNSVPVVVMAVSLAGGLQAVLSKSAIRCACPGTMFQLPMSTVTIMEDGLMLTMAAAMLIGLR